MVGVLTDEAGAASAGSLASVGVEKTLGWDRNVDVVDSSAASSRDAFVGASEMVASSCGSTDAGAADTEVAPPDAWPADSEPRDPLAPPPNPGPGSGVRPAW